MLKSNSKRKRRRSELDQVKEEELELKSDKDTLLKNYKRLKLEENVMVKVKEKSDWLEQKIGFLIESGIIDDEGNPKFKI